MSSPRVIPGAEAFRFEGGPVGILLLHGFTGNPTSMRPMGEFLASKGFSVAAPRYPGHGTTWEELAKSKWEQWEAEAEAALRELDGRTETVVAAGLSMGGSMALHLAAKHPDTIKGVAVINAFIRNPQLPFARVARLFARSRKGVGNDIKKPAQNEAPYERVPYAGIIQLHLMLKTVQSELPSVRQPLLVFNAPEDHVVPKDNAQFVMDRVGSEQKELVTLPNSYHVATLDYDAETIQDRLVEFARAAASEAGR
ncbi:MAG: alpha/beta fold hydrolase [Actinobacteria bacterium]|nr:alpha/beta fold hydrolase [Actinomycetota bacterium]